MNIFNNYFDHKLVENGVITIKFKVLVLAVGIPYKSMIKPIVETKEARSTELSSFAKDFEKIVIVGNGYIAFELLFNLISHFGSQTGEVFLLSRTDQHFKGFSPEV